MTCEELRARLNSQKAALLRLQAEEAAYYANQFSPYGNYSRLSSFDELGTRTRVSGCLGEYEAAKAAYDSAYKRYQQALRG